MCRAGEGRVIGQAQSIGALPWCICTIMVQRIVPQFYGNNLKLLICTPVYLARIMLYDR